MSRVLQLPETFSIAKQDYYDFGAVLGWFDWSIRDEKVTIDFEACLSADYQALALLMQYVWHLQQSCSVAFVHSSDPQSASAMWQLMETQALIVLRNSDDAQRALQQLDHFAKGFDLEYAAALSQVVSDLLYNTREHGASTDGIPSVVQFSYHEKRKELSVIIADLGIGVKLHLEQRYPGLESDEAALHKAIEPNVSGHLTMPGPVSMSLLQSCGR